LKPPDLRFDSKVIEDNEAFFGEDLIGLDFSIARDRNAKDVVLMEKIGRMIHTGYLKGDVA